ncbi:MAG: hypothetical protein JWM21_4403 [Acidobacteria bacterium]|nr:hypothetical protein [Acidobacteriota bacterium]
MMLKRISCVSLLLTLALSFSGCAAGTGGASATVTNPRGAGQTPASAAGELKYKVPAGWVTEEPSSKMRVAQFKLARVEGDAEDASLVVYFFGSGQGGAVSDNVDRWVNQMQQADGSPSKDKAKIETVTINGLKVTTVDVSGTYTAQMSPGSDARHNDSNQRLRAAVVETPKGNYFAKLVGPAKTVSRWDQSFVEYVKSFEFK